MNHRVDLLGFRLSKKLHIDSHRACSWLTYALAVCKCASPLHSHQRLLSLLFLDDVTLIGVRWNLSVVPVRIALMASHVFPTYLLATDVSSFHDYLLSSLAHVLTG